MKFVIVNGSPRYKNSNSKVLMEHFLSGYSKKVSTDVPIYYLANRKQRDKMDDVFQQAETLILIFPLYTDSMPGIVKEFFEKIAARTYDGSKKIGFIVQSGFPEAVHSVSVERYLEKFTRRINCSYMGTVIKGGVEGIKVMPPAMTKKLFKQMNALGEYFAETSTFSPEINEAMRQPFKMSLARRTVFRLLGLTGITNFYWNGKLKEHKAYERRFAKPFE